MPCGAISAGDRPHAAKDAVRDRWFAAQGVWVLRYSASEVLTNLEGVVREVMMITLGRLGTSES